MHWFEYHKLTTSLIIPIFIRNEKWVILCLKIMSILLHNRHFVCIKTRGKVHFLFFFHIKLYSNAPHILKKDQKLDTISNHTNSLMKNTDFCSQKSSKIQPFPKTTRQGMLLNCRQYSNSHYSVGTNLVKGIFYDLYVTF